MKRNDTPTQLTALLKSKKVFVRERKPTELAPIVGVVTALRLLYLGLSCRQAVAVLASFDEASYEVASRWYHRAKKLLHAPPRRCRKAIARSIDVD